MSRNRRWSALCEVTRDHYFAEPRDDPGPTRLIRLIQDLGVRVINAAIGELLCELTLNPDRDYQPTGAPKGPTRK